MNPEDAALRSLGHGNQVRVWNERGEVIRRLAVTDAVRPGVVASEKGAWLMTSPTGQTISALVSADLKADQRHPGRDQPGYALSRAYIASRGTGQRQLPSIFEVFLLSNGTMPH